MSRSDGAPRVGEAYALPEDDYRYGRGAVVVRIRQVHGPVEYRGEPWWHVSVDAASGTPQWHGGFNERDLYLRASTMPMTRLSGIPVR